MMNAITRKPASWPKNVDTLSPRLRGGFLAHVDADHTTGQGPRERLHRRPQVTGDRVRLLLELLVGFLQRRGRLLGRAALHLVEDLATLGARLVADARRLAAGTRH